MKIIFFFNQNVMHCIHTERERSTEISPEDFHLFRVIVFSATGKLIYCVCVTKMQVICCFSVPLCYWCYCCRRFWWWWCCKCTNLIGMRRTICMESNRIDSIVMLCHRNAQINKRIQCILLEPCTIHIHIILYPIPPKCAASTKEQSWECHSHTNKMRQLCAERRLSVCVYSLRLCPGLGVSPCLCLSTTSFFFFCLIWSR